MKNNSKWLAAALSVVAVLLINWVSGLEFFRIDLTEGKVYTLSDGTKQILKNLDEPVTLRFYVSQGDDNMPLPLKGYARRVEDLLREFKAASKGKLVIEKLDPQPDSDAEDTASLDGVQPQSLNTGERFYFGLVVKRGEQKSAIPSIVMQRERLLEYDIVRAITRTAITKKTKIGVLSSIPVFGSPGMPMMGMPPSPKQVFISELERDFEVVRVSGSSTKIDDEVKVLLVIHPKGLSESTEFAIDQFILRGGKVIALLDSYAYFDLIPTPQGMQPGGSSSNLERLTKAWGVTFETEKMLADLQFMTGKGNRALPTLLTLNETAYSPTDIATAQLGEVLLAFTGAFTSSLTPGLKQVDLIKSSGYSELVSKEIAMEKGEQLGTMIKPSGQSYPIAIRLEGQFKTAFPDGMPKSAANESASKSPLVKADASKGPASKEVDVAVPVSEVLTQSKENNAVILIADSDFINDNVAVQIQEIFGQRIVYPTNGNLAFLQSLVDQFAGDAALVSLRARQSTSYPFTVIREMETRAQQAYVGKIKALEENLQKTRESLAEIQKNKSPADSGAILNAEQLAQVENFKKTAAQTSQELKSLRKDLRADSEALQFWAKVLNIALIPLLVFLTGLGFYFWGSRRAR
ncbi:MAG: GldG family protein [Polynucleobacter sp.]|jgi:ABC-type uncharacterized transport system involved in gliding motility auxiliary subunit|nr:GldG family protein [Polynucleobacter sp.]